MKRTLFVALAFAIAPAAAFAGTCAAPTSMHDGGGQQVGRTYSGTTCGGEAGINLGGVVLGHPSFVYSFTANSASNAGAPGGVNMTMPNGTVVITRNCTEAPTAFGTPAAAMSVEGAAGLIDGQTYLMIVTTDPGVPVTAPPTCAAFTLTIPTLPVSLQEFSVD